LRQNLSPNPKSSARLTKQEAKVRKLIAETKLAEYDYKHHLLIKPFTSLFAAIIIGTTLFFLLKTCYVEIILRNEENRELKLENEQLKVSAYKLNCENEAIEQDLKDLKC